MKMRTNVTLNICNVKNIDLQIKKTKKTVQCIQYIPGFTSIFTNGRFLFLFICI